MILKDPTALEHLTLDSVVNDAVINSVKENRIILIRNGAEYQINLIKNKLVSKLKEKYPERIVYVLDGDHDINIIKKIYNCAYNDTLNYIKMTYIIFDYFNFIKRDKEAKSDYVINVKGCFGSTLPR